ncbi:MAG: bifunctional phosphoribosylaminoimidazolecarboxamide formyltransferase/IMP cyclohydrolase [Magnetococcales bacterium]|nr:bifunctional phosphoribosylaminoimidazolecarboxamide formyltransferase/IMP cyclohydrolase [Magnetococcales bacterium]MBF0157829.1 bifunctional phosphoribosylaminoimidazolecarboxamide formyltransferase/IMP cyclohydrolase [Magnetococcales bacterium]
MIKIQRALISVSDKSGLVDFAQALAGFGVEILSTGGTAQALAKGGIEVKDVSEFTGFPEVLDGRVKTLHPKVHGGLLGVRDNPEHRRVMAELGMEPIDMLVVNLYPFEATVARPGCTLEEAIENIDIGGPAMLRSAAKNHRFVTVVVDPGDYGEVLDELKNRDGHISMATNAAFARKVFARTAAYDAAISNWLSSRDEEGGGRKHFPEVLTTQFVKAQEMRYGENPHQQAAFYVERGFEEASVANAAQLQGKSLSFNNVHDANGALELVKEFDRPAVVIVKHTNPCGVALDDDLLEAYRRARAADPVSAFGGVIAMNRPVDGPLAREIAATFVEAIIAPGFDQAAQDIFAAKKNLRLLLTRSPEGGVRSGVGLRLDLKRVTGGLLVQEPDQRPLRAGDLKVVTERAPTEAEMEDLLFAWKVVKHVKSNAIVYARGKVTVGVGAGQMSRVDASRIAVWKAREVAAVAGRSDDPLAGSVLASDAFFPFRDGLDAAAEAGATAVIQPGGSVRDDEVIQAANEHRMAMVFTGVRHFKH